MDESNPNYTKIMEYIDHNPAAVLSTICDDGQPHGAVIYICTASHGTVCFVTKNQTKKFANLQAHPLVSLTIFSEKQGSTLQAQGKAFVADDPEMIDYVIRKTKDSHAMRADWLPPVTKIHSGDFVVIGIELSGARLAEYQGIDINGATFTEI